MTKIHTILILAGGDGDRFAPLKNKMRYRFNGMTVLQHVVSRVQEYAEQVVVVVGEHNKTLIKNDLSTYSVKYALQTKADGGMADAILSAEEYCTNDALILNANDLFDFSILPQLVEQTKNEVSQVGIVAKHITEYFPGGYVIFKDNKAVGLVEKPGPDKMPSNYTRLVADYFPDTKLYLSEIKKLSPSDDQCEKATTVLMEKKPATCFKYEGDWTTLKYSWHVLSMQEYALAKLATAAVAEGAKIHKTALIEGVVVIGKNVKIGAFSKINGPCYIGDNTVIGDHTLIRQSTLCDNVVVGSGCEVARSYLGESVMLHRNYVGDSVLGARTSMGAGAVTANYPFDKKTIRTPIKGRLIDSGNDKFGLIAGADVKIGVNSSTYPGVKLSSGTRILPGEVVTKDK